MGQTHRRIAFVAASRIAFMPARRIAFIPAALTAATLALATVPGFAGDAPDPDRPGVQRILQLTVNDTATDITAEDQQSTTTVVAVGNTVAVAWTDSAASAISNNHRTGFGNSSNGGLSFTDRGGLPDSAIGDFGSPVLAADQSTGAIYLATRPRQADHQLPVFKSTDGGTTFGAPANGAPGFQATFDFHFSPGLAVDNFAGSGNGTVYLCWSHIGSAFAFHTIRLSRSTDGGATFGPSGGTIVSSSGGSGCDVVVGKDHAVHVFFLRGTGTNGNGGDNRILVRKSVDFGVTLLPEVEVADVQTSGGGGDLSLRGGVSSSAFPEAAVNPASGRLYVAWNDDPLPGPANDNSDIFLVRSSDGGATWTAPAAVNDDNAGRDQFFPALAFTPDGKQAMLGYYSRVHDSGNLLFHRRGRLATVRSNGALTMNRSFQLSADSPLARGSTAMSSYDQIAATTGAFHSVWSDNLLRNAFHVAQADVRYARIASTPSATDLALVLGGAPSTGQGTTQAFDVTVSSDVGVATDVFVSITLPPGLNLRSATPDTGTCRGAGLVGCYIGTLNPGASKTVHLLLAGIEPGLRTISAEVTTSSIDANAANDTASFGTTVVAVAGAQQIFSSGTLATPIVNGGTIEIPIDVTFESTVLDADVFVRLNHGFDVDVSILLIAPSGRTLDLSSNNGSDGDNYGSGALTCNGTSTVFNDSAPASVIDGVAPFSGQFRPEEALTELIGEPVEGQWRLRVSDQAITSDPGTFGCFKLRFLTGS